MKPVIIGAGLAGLTAALSLAPMPVILLSAGKFGGESSSAWAQGGIAAAIDKDDSPALHAADTMHAGAGLCDANIVRQVTDDGAQIIAQLLGKKVGFDRDAAGGLQLGLEGGHSRRRIIHYGDASGGAIMKALIAAARATPPIEIMENTRAIELLTEDGVSGIWIETGGKISLLRTGCVVLATGGAGALWKYTTNPLGSWGQGLALAAKAGANLADLEFMQFHPTAIDVGRDPMPLASEALRGEGAILIDEHGERFTDELQPRDIVARAIWAHTKLGRRVFLDARAALGASFAARFPSVYTLCMSAGIDPTRQPIPVRPAAHYHMGGVVTDAQGRSSVKGLWACGEAARTGLHGANRLASNSLLEAASFGRRVAEDIAGLEAKPAAVLQKKSAAPVVPANEGKDKIRTLMSWHAGMMRDREGLEQAIAGLTPLAGASDMALVALMIASAALRREESRGAQMRTDYPMASPALAHPHILNLADILPAPLYPIAAGASR